MTVAKGTALITGASSGIGATFARALAERGYDLILVARRLDRLERLAEELRASRGVRAEVMAADLTKDEDLAAVEQRLSGETELTLLVNNAGFGTRGRFSDAELDTQERMHRLHVLATLRLTHAALPRMMARDHGGVINVSSVAGFTATPGNASYCATKAWMNFFTEALSLELASAGSRVKMQALCPGFTYTEFHDVMGVDRKVIPRSWWMPAEKVVAASLRGLDQGKLVVVPGLRYKLLVAVTGLIPGSLRRAATMVYAKRMKRS